MSKLSTIKRAGLFILPAIVLFSSGFLVGQKLEIGSLTPENVVISRNLPESKNLNFDLFWHVWDTLETNYYDKKKLVPSKMVYGAIKGMVAAVGDPYTTFLTPEENKITGEDLQGNFGGVGIQVGFRGTQLAVVAPLPDSPAEKADIKAGDYIVGITDEQKGIERGTNGISLSEAVSIIRGPAGTSVKLTLVREGTDDPFEVDVVRSTIDVPSVTVKFVGPDQSIAHLRLMKFGGETKKEWDTAIIEVVKQQNLKGIVIDVRSNPGGYLQGAVEIASDFVDVGSTVVIEEKGTGEKIPYKTENHGRLTQVPIVVLMNKGSASASEILAGALRDLKKTKLVGTVSFGKGTIQERQELNEGVALHITAAKWLTPNETWVHEKGLEPDVTVENNPQTVDDEQLLEAIKVVTSQK